MHVKNNAISDKVTVSAMHANNMIKPKSVDSKPLIMCSFLKRKPLITGALGHDKIILVKLHLTAGVLAWLYQRLD